MAFLVHGANVLFLLSYLVRDILWLRCLTVIAIGMLFPYYLANNLLPPIIWNVVFLGINALQIRALLLERRPVTLDARETRLYQRVFRSLSPREFLRLSRTGAWVTAPAGRSILARGQQLDALRVIERGRLEVLVDGEVVAHLSEGQFVGEMGFLTERPCSAEVSAAEETTFLAWDCDALRTLLAARPELRSAMQLVIGTDLAGKLRRG